MKNHLELSTKETPSFAQTSVETSIAPLLVLCSETSPNTQLNLATGIEGEELKE